MTNPIDWLEITIKFRGKCCECGKEITSGQAFWSKSTKAVKHIDCPTRNVNNQAIASTNERICKSGIRRKRIHYCSK